MKTTVSDRLKEIMERYKLRQVDILKRAEPYCTQYGIKMGRNDLSQYVSGKVSPGQDKLTILALALEVSETWLMGYDVPMERSPQESQRSIPVDAELEDVCSLLKKLNDFNKKKVLDYSRTLLEVQQMEEENKAYLLPDAAHKRTDLPKDELNDKARNKHDDDIMDDLNF